MKYINQTKNGSLYVCPKCDKIHIEFNNLNFNFSNKEYTAFVRYISNLNGAFWEKENSNTNYKRKIIIPIGNDNFNIVLNNGELEELKLLFTDTLDKDLNYGSLIYYGKSELVN